MKQSTKYLIALGFFQLACGGSPTSELSITNGRPIADSTWPAIVPLYDASNESLFCTGTFIRSNVVLTAAHCTGTQQMTVRVNGGSYLSKRVVVNQEYLVSGDFRYKAHNDFSLLVFSENIATKTMNVCDQVAQVGSPVTIAGFGYNDMSAFSGEGVKREGYSQLTGAELGELTLKGQISPSDSSGYNASVGGGDSGSPVIDSENSCIWGVASWAQYADSRTNIEGHYGSLRSDLLGLGFNWIDYALEHPELDNSVGADPDALYEIYLAE